MTSAFSHLQATPQALAKTRFRFFYRQQRCLLAQGVTHQCDEDLCWGVERAAQIALADRNARRPSLADRLDLHRWVKNADPMPECMAWHDVEFPHGEFAPQCNVGPLYY
jgi:hypothetical protein